MPIKYIPFFPEPIEGQARRIGTGEDEGSVASYPRSVRRRRQAAKV